MSHICFNGKIRPAADPLLTAANRGYRYGDGLFETMKVQQGKIALASLHFERLLQGLALLQLKLPAWVNPASLTEEVLRLCTLNDCTAGARVRLSVYRGEGGLYDGNPAAGYIIECWPLDPAENTLNENGLWIDIFPLGRKSTDAFSTLKSANALIYVMAALHAREQKWNDALVLNTAGNIADSTIANLFLVRDNRLFTPALTEGSVNGVMRRYLIAQLREAGEEVTETQVSPSMVAAADELFLTNAIKGIRWVKQCGDSCYGNEKTRDIYQRFGRTNLS